jgi:Flp pilus assembly protein CpaB
VRASTLFAATAAVLAGLGTVAVAKYSGLFSPAAPAPAPAKPEPTMILAANKTLFEGTAINPNDVYVRALKPEEEEAYKAHKEQYLPPLQTAVAYRILAKNMEADQPMLREDLQDQAFPDPLNQRLDPHMRAVNVSVRKEDSAGGLITTGERVDLYLTTAIGVPGESGQTTNQTACIARDLKVIAKRDTLWPVLASIPDGPVSFTLEANPYRAALIEFAKTRGDFTLVPTPAPKQVKPASRGTGSPPTFSDPDSKEYRDEDVRVAAFSNGELTVGDRDLERIFNLKLPTPPAPPIKVERYSGVNYQGLTVFPAPGQSNFVAAASSTTTAAGSAVPDTKGFSFQSPGSSSGAPANCPTCGKQKK